MCDGLPFGHTSSKQAVTCCSRLWNITQLLKEYDARKVGIIFDLGMLKQTLTYFKKKKANKALHTCVTYVNVKKGVQEHKLLTNVTRGQGGRTGRRSKG